MKSDEFPMLLIRSVAPISCSEHWINMDKCIRLDEGGQEFQVTFLHDIGIPPRKDCNTFNTVDGRNPAPGTYKILEITG